MINALHARFHRPENGWDPISPEYADGYSANEWEQGVDESLLDELDRWVGGLAGKRVLDLGGGPGHYSVAFAKRKADVIWHDVSHTYRKIAERKAAEHNVRMRFSIGYMEDAAWIHKEPFDLVFNRICWSYGMSDRRLAKVVYGLVKAGGVVYVDAPHSEALEFSLQRWLNKLVGLKIGHPYPPHGRVAKLFLDMPIARIRIDYTSPSNDRVLLLKK